MRAACTLCGSGSVELVYESAGASRDVLVVRCAECRHIFQGEWSDVFEAEMYAYYDQFLTREDVFTALNAARYQELLASFAEHTPGRRLLDVGCGAGAFVAAAVDAGWDALGIDLSSAGIACCQRFDVPSRLIDFFDSELDDSRYDVIFMSELIEHVPNPDQFIRRAEAMLVPGGLLYLTTPNYDSLARRMIGASWPCFHREHLSYFTPATLRRMLERGALLDIRQLASRNFPVGALVGEAHRLARRLGNGRKASTAPTATLASTRSVDQSLRSRIAGSPLLGRVREGLNAALNASGAGDSLVILAQRRSASVIP